MLIIDLNAESVFLIAAMFAGFITIPLLFINRKNRKANSILAFLQLIILGGLFHNLLLASGIYQKHPDLYFLPVSLRLGTAPLLLFYCYSLTGKRISLSAVLLHLLPALFVFAFECWVFSLDVSAKWQLWTNHISFWWDHVYFWFYQFQIIIYILIIRQRLRNWKLQLENQFSETSRFSLNWMYQLIGIYLFFCAVSIAGKSISAFTGKEIPIPLTDIIRAIILIAVGWFSMRQNQIRFTDEPNEGAAQNDISIERKTENTIEAESENLPVNEEILGKIRTAMENERLFLDESLSLHKLARTLNLPGKQVSSTINRGTGLTFLAFVNSYRVQEVCRRIEAGDHQKLTLLAIALESGFNSKSTFNRVFKEITGKSPSDFLKT